MVRTLYEQNNLNAELLGCLEAAVMEKDTEISRLCNKEMEKDLRLQAQHRDFQAQLSAEQMAREQVTNTLELMRQELEAHRQIPVQLQSVVRKCLNNWLKQGIICPSKSPYTSQVVIVHKKTGEIHLCVDFRKLNAISIRNSFPLPCVEEALQAVQAAVWFSSFDLAQGYLQMAMEEEDIEKTVFCTGSSGRYEFTCMPFGLTNAGASFCRLMEMCIGDQ